MSELYIWITVYIVRLILNGELMTPLHLMKLLADDTRLTAILMMKSGPRCVCDLMTALDLSQPKVSRHLAILRDASLVETERRGQWVYYSLATNLPEWVVNTIELLLQSPAAQDDPRLHPLSSCQTEC